MQLYVPHKESVIVCQFTGNVLTRPECSNIGTSIFTPATSRNWELIHYRQIANDSLFLFDLYIHVSIVLGISSLKLVVDQTTEDKLLHHLLEEPSS